MPSERVRSNPPSEENLNDEEILQSYLSRLMTLQDEQAGSWLEEADLLSAAQDLGLSGTDLERLASTVEAHLQRGRQFTERGLWDEAVEAFRQASTLRPLDGGITYELSKAYLNRWHKRGDDADRMASERYAHRTLQLDPNHTASYEVLQELKRRRVHSAAPTAEQVGLSKALLLGGILVFLMLLAAFFMLL